MFLRQLQLGLLTTLFFAQAWASTEKIILTANEINVTQENKNFFNKIVGGLKSDLYKVRAQNFSSFNLDLQTFIHFRRSPVPGLNHKETFSLASDGNQIIHGVPVWPIQGNIVYHLDESFRFENQSVQLRPIPGVFYLLESEQGHSERMNRWGKLKEKLSYTDYARASGKIVGVVQMDLTRISIEFYQLNPDTNEMISAGVATGAAVVR